MAMELEPIATPFEPAEDRRPKIEPPPPVRLIAIDDCRLPAAAGLERKLDQFYVGLLHFFRGDDPREIVYIAENHDLHFDIDERPQPREDMRSLGIAVPSLTDLVQQFNDAEIEFIRLRGLTPGADVIALYDPAGNPLEIIQYGIAI
jgi:hypothetical protein